MSELREALTATGASALVPKIIDPVLLEYQRRYSPLVRAVPTTPWDSDTYYWNQRTAVATGGFVPDGGARPVANSTYVQNNFKMAHVQVVGAVTGYAQQVTRQVIGDLRQTEIEGSIRGFYWDIETGIDWGNAASTANGPQPQFDGLDTQVNTFSGSTQNVIDAAGNSLSLGYLDQVIDMVQTNAAEPIFNDNWMFMMSPTAHSRLNQLLVNQQRYMQVEIAAGLIVDTYRNIPIVDTTFLSSRSLVMGAVTTTPGAASTGSLPTTTTYYYQVSPVIARQGELLASTEVSGTTTAANSSMQLSFSTPTGLDGAQPILYKVWRTTGGGGTGTETFLGYVDATVGLSADGVTPIMTTSIVDTGTALVPYNGATAPATPPTQYYGTNTAMKPNTATINGENIYLISRDRNNVVRPYVREAQPLDVYPTTAAPDTLPYALVGDTTFAVRGPKFLGRLYRAKNTLSN